MGLQRLTCAMHAFYASLIDRAASFAQQSEVPYFGLAVEVAIPHQPIRLGEEPEPLISPRRGIGPDMVPIGTPETERVLHPTVNLYVPRKM